MKTIRDIGEFGLIRQIQRFVGAASPPRFSADVVVGIGDDCAVLRGADPKKYWLYTCDPVVEGIHTRAADPARAVGWKAMARNLSDVAAMGGRPRWAIVSIGLRPDTSVRAVRELYAGLLAAAKKFGCQIVGGDTTHVKHEQFVVVAVIGEVEKSRIALRSGATIGDSVFVTGTLGGSIHGKHLRFAPRIAEARWLVENFRIHAMIDISDGLSSDLQRLVEAGNSRVGFEIFEAEIPIAPAARGSLQAALNDGEDFELLFTIDPREVTGLRRRWARKFKLKLTEIGRVVKSPGTISLIRRDGSKQAVVPAGYDHFANS
jgi:thiamine-monophosphate kinase